MLSLWLVCYESSSAIKAFNSGRYDARPDLTPIALSLLTPIASGLPVLGLIVIGATTRNDLMRRRLWTTRTLYVNALLTLERHRIDKRTRYWRESTWFVTVLWSALALIAVLDSTMNPDARTASRDGLSRSGSTSLLLSLRRGWPTTSRAGPAKDAACSTNWSIPKTTECKTNRHSRQRN